jgi:hypothetical protein
MDEVDSLRFRPGDRFRAPRGRDAPVPGRLGQGAPEARHEVDGELRARGREPVAAPAPVHLRHEGAAPQGPCLGPDPVGPLADRPDRGPAAPGAEAATSGRF